MESLTNRTERIAACVLVLLLTVACVAIGAMVSSAWREPQAPAPAIIPMRMA